MNRSLVWLALGGTVVAAGVALLVPGPAEKFDAGVGGFHRAVVANPPVPLASKVPGRLTEPVRRAVEKSGAALVIPSIGLITTLDAADWEDVSVFDSGAVRWTGGAEPGEPGNLSIGAHRVTHGDPFRHVDRLQEGDLVRVVTNGGGLHTYRLTEDPWALNAAGGGWIQGSDMRAATITLVTCASEIRRTDERLAVRGVLVDTTTSTPTKEVEK